MRGSLVHGRTGWEYELVDTVTGAITAHGWSAGRRKDAEDSARLVASERGIEVVKMPAPRVGVRCVECGATARISVDTTRTTECAECGSTDIEVIQ